MDNYSPPQPNEEIDNRPPRIVREKAIRHRKQMTIAAEFCSIVSLSTLIVVFLGSTHISDELDNIWFLRIDSRSPFPKQNPLYTDFIIDIVKNMNSPQVPHFYQVGLWNYCEGFDGKGITYCSAPTPMHYFNPIEIMLKKAVPTKYEPDGMAEALERSQPTSKSMFACFFLGGTFSLISLVLDWLSIVVSRNYILTPVFALCAASFTNVSAIISSQLFIRFWFWLESTPDLTIHSQLGAKMYSCIWVSAIFSLAAFVLYVKVAANISAGKPGWKIETLSEEQLPVV